MNATMSFMTPHRLLIVSNRLPVSAHAMARGIHTVNSRTASRPSCGAGTNARTASARVAWRGVRSDPFHRDDLDRRLGNATSYPCICSGDHLDRYYDGFANRVCGFCFTIDPAGCPSMELDAYREVNEAFADVVAREYRPTTPSGAFDRWRLNGKHVTDSGDLPS